MKRLVKRTIQGAVACAAPMLWRARRSSLLILMYHRVLPADHPDRATEQPGMYVSPQTLAMHLDVLKEHFTLLQLDEWIERTAQKRTVPARACAITFDDGWRDNYVHAYPILRQAAAPATIFLVADLVGTRYSFWPNILARVLTRNDPEAISRLPRWVVELVTAAQAGSAHCGALDSKQIDAIICQCKAARSDADMLAMLRGLADSDAAPDVQRDLMSWSEIKELQDSGLVRFGSHTRRHSRLSGAWAADALHDEVIGSRGAIQQQLGLVPRTFCYPNGDTSQQAIAVVRSAYLGAVTTARGWNGVRSDRCLLNRVGMHDDVSSTRSAFLSRLAGVG